MLEVAQNPKRPFAFLPLILQGVFQEIHLPTD